jgi:diguanylate cyclase (GGDEF)-like protein
MGIAGRLALSFAAVAILAAAANLIIERGVAVVHTTRLDRGLFSPLPLPPAPAPAPAPEVSPTEEVAAVKHRPEPVVAVLSGDHFQSAIERFQHAIQVRSSVDSLSATSEVQAARYGLDSAAAELQTDARRKALAAAPGLGEQLAAYIVAGGTYIQVSDARRVALREYTSRMEAMNRRISSSLDRAWKIFGRVLARQSLMRLNADLEVLSRRFAVIGGSDSYGSAAVESVASGERALAMTFEGNVGSFARSEGADWVREMREDLAQTEALRESIVRDDTQIRESALKFEDARAQLVTAMPKPHAEAVVRAPAPASSAKRAAAAPPATLPPITPVASAVPQADPPLLVAAAPIPDAVITTAVPDERDRRSTIAAITAAMLCVLLAVSVLTVRSISVPVSRMLAATEKLAGGNVDVRVPRGGIKELDTLAIAFNRMAAQLRAARVATRDYREHLETQVEQRTRQLQHLAEHDPLTSLPNRRQFFALLDHALQRAAQTRRSVALFFIDIDNFKNLNDSMGHAFGDRVLMSVAQRLSDAAGNFGFAARLGGDEFTVVYQDAPSAQAAYEAGRKLVKAFQQSLEVDGRNVTVSISVGVSLYPDHEILPEELLSAADAALFRAKALGRSQLAIFTPELLEAATRKFTTEQGLRRALERNEFELVFQPQVSLDSLEVGLVEALLRWRLPDGRRAKPEEFLPVMEESGLVVQIGNWVLRNAIATASNWHHGLWPNVKIAINVSPRQLLDHRFVEHVQELLLEYRLPARCIELELTESVLQTGSATIETLRVLRSLDIAIALDDFGTGYSSLASLVQLPLSRIKLDRALMATIDTNARSATIIVALIKLCEGLGLEVTAEGIERPAQFRCLAANRAIHLQGYLMAPPVVADQVLRIKGMIPQIMQDLLLSSATRSTPASEGPRSAARGVIRSTL